MARSLRSDRALAKLGRYVVTEHAYGSVATYRPSSTRARSLLSDRAHARFDRYEAIKLSQKVDTTLISFKLKGMCSDLNHMKVEN